MCRMLQVLSLLATLRHGNTVINNLIESDLVGTAFPALQARPHPIPPFFGQYKLKTPPA